MSAYQQKHVSATWDQVTAFRLARHHLSPRGSTRALVSVAGDMTGAQAQLFSAAQISLWSRVHGLTIKHIEDALARRTLVKAACMRRTLFLVPSKDLAIFVRGSAGRAEKGIQWARGKGIPDRAIDKAIEAAIGVLDAPLTRLEIAERVSQALRVQMKFIQGGGWGSRSKVAAVPIGEITFPVVDLLHLVGARGVICYGPSRGNEPTFVRADAWIPQWQDRPREEATALLLQKYLQVFGPANVPDFALWTGMSLTEARQVWARSQDNFAIVDVEGWAGTILRKDLDTLMQAEIERPLVRLLPYFDTFLLGHKGRGHLVDIQHGLKIFRPQGWIAPVVLLNGRVVAVWQHTQEGGRLHIKVERFGSLSRRIATGIQQEAQDLARFLGIPKVDVQFG